MPRNRSYSGDTALGPADAKLHKVSTGEGKLLTSFLLAVSLPFCCLSPLGVQKCKWGWSIQKHFSVKDLGFHWSVQSREARKAMSKNVHIQCDLKYLSKILWRKVC